MGILTGSAQVLLSSKHQLAMGGHLGMLGKQNVVISPSQWQEILSQLNLDLDSFGPLKTERHLRWKTDHISTDYFFRALGFSDISVIDVSRYENADYIFDLNKNELPRELLGKFDYIFDGSTIEHIFHIPNVLANIFKMLRVGGKVLHMAPSNQFMDDGFYQLSPTFFDDYYRVNRYNVLFSKLHYIQVRVDELDGKPTISTQDRVVPYERTELNDVSSRFASHGTELCQTFFLAEKTKDSTYDQIPFQTRYSEKSYWREHLTNPLGDRRDGHL